MRALLHAVCLNLGPKCMDVALDSGVSIMPDMGVEMDLFDYEAKSGVL